VAKVPYWDFKKWPPDIRWYMNNKAREVIIYCGSSDFVTNDGLAWVHKEGGLEVEAQGFKINGQWTLCNKDTESVVLRLTQGPVDLLLLCGILETDYPGEANIAYRATYKTLHNRRKEPGKQQELDYGVSFDSRRRRVLSFMLLHEMLHIARGDKSQYSPS
jgi:hypothetical protein